MSSSSHDRSVYFIGPPSPQCYTLAGALGSICALLRTFSSCTLTTHPLHRLGVPCACARCLLPRVSQHLNNTRLYRNLASIQIAHKVFAAMQDQAAINAHNSLTVPLFPNTSASRMESATRLGPPSFVAGGRVVNRGSCDTTLFVISGNGI